MNQLNSLCIVGLLTVTGFAVGYTGVMAYQRYVAPAMERRQWLREYHRQKAIEHAAMIAIFAPRPAEKAAAERFFSLAIATEGTGEGKSGTYTIKPVK